MQNTIHVIYLTQGIKVMVKAGEIGHVSLIFEGLCPVAPKTDTAATGKIASPHLVLVEIKITGISGNPIQVLYDQ